MPELCFLRHGPRVDSNPTHPPLSYKPYDPPVTSETSAIAKEVANEFVSILDFAATKKNIYIHFSPYLRCCQTADILLTELQKRCAEQFPEVTVKFHLLGDFALSEWIHDNMKNKPPFFDTAEAYQMYTPNVQQMTNRRCVLNFRPTTQLGPWNEPGILFKEFLERCKDYFKKLLATYDTPGHEDDTIVVVTHGYVVSTMLSYFINHPIFEEIPEFSTNFAAYKDGHWCLQKDCLGFLQRDPTLDARLNLETDVVYYKTNFIKKTAFDQDKQYPPMGFVSKSTTEPRPSFRIELPSRPQRANNPLCSAARNWNAQDSNKFKIKADFKKKIMSDDVFKKAFDLKNHPSRAISPEVSPNSAPSRTNSMVDLSKLASNEEIYHPFKLRYSLASDISVKYLNSKVNSQVSLTHPPTSYPISHPSSNGASFASLVGSPARPSSIPTALSLLSNQFRESIGLERSLEALEKSLEALEKSLKSESTEMGDISMHDVISCLARVHSLQRKRAQSATPKFDVISENEDDQLDLNPSFTLQFGNNSQLTKQSTGVDNLEETRKIEPLESRDDSRNWKSTDGRLFQTLSLQSSRRDTTSGSSIPKKKIQFFEGSGSSGEDSLDEDADSRYMWFGQNVKN